MTEKTSNNTGKVDQKYSFLQINLLYLKKRPFQWIIFFFQDYHDAVFVVGSLDETLILRGMRYHPIDIENSVMRAHKKIAEW